MTEPALNKQMLEGMKVLVATPGCPELSHLRDAIGALGAVCVGLDADQDFTDLAAIETAFGRARAAMGGVDAIVLAVGTPQSRQARMFVSLSPEQWRAACLDPLRTSRHCLQAAWRTLAGEPGSIVVVGPNFSLTGAGGLAALSVLSEGQRAMMKSAARQWGAQGIRLNWLGLDAHVFDAQLANAALPLSPEMGPPPPALGFVPGITTGVAQTIAMLIGATAITGASIPVDGGVWMVP